MVMSLPSTGLVAAYRRFESWCIDRGLDPDATSLKDVIDYLWHLARLRQRPQKRRRS
jgi:hypothetical protein